MGIILDLSGEIWKIVSFFSVLVSLCLLAKDAYVNLQNFVAGGNMWTFKHHTETILYQGDWSKGGKYMLCIKWSSEILTHGKSQRISVFFGGPAKYVQDCDQTKTSHLQSCLLTCFSLNPQKSETTWWRCFFFPGILSMSLSYQSFCVVDGGWNDVDDPGKMVCELWTSATFRCRSSVQRACPTAGMLQVYHESWQKHLIKPPKHHVMEQRYLSEN